MEKATKIILAFAALNAALFSWFSNFVAEDAYIVYRYSENLANGNGLVFNSGEYVSALTSPLHSLIVSVLYFMSGESVWSNRILALLLYFGSTLYAYRTLGKDRMLGLYGLLIWISPYVIFWIAGGLETMFLASFLTIAFASACQCTAQYSRRNQFTFSICLGLAFLTRFDSCLVTLPMWFHVASKQWGFNESKRIQSIIRLLLPGLLIATTWLATAYIYYHDIFPTSVYHKPARWDHQRTNVLYMLQFGLFSGMLPLLGWAVVSHAGHPSSYPLGQVFRTIAKRYWGTLIGGLIFFGYATGTATAHMMFSYRMLLPYLPILAMMTIQLLDNFHVEGLRAGRFGNRGWNLVLGLAITIQGLQFYYIDQFSVNPGRYGEYTNLSRQTYIEFMDILEQQAETINRHWAQNGEDRDPQIHVYAAGVLPYNLKRSKIVDWGLVSYRKNVKVHAIQRGLLYSSDYIITLTPRHFTKKHQLQRDPKSLELIDERQLAGFDHADDRMESFSVFFNPSPIDYRLPEYIDGPELTPIPEKIE
ncbi:MAG: hypothetical protein CMJ82_07360 [Planctomycetaceae bacterium]|nr:hypothetical protein [Planctomycetaceae bacterium]